MSCACAWLGALPLCDVIGGCHVMVLCISLSELAPVNQMCCLAICEFSFSDDDRVLKCVILLLRYKLNSLTIRYVQLCVSSMVVCERVSARLT